MRNKAIIFMEAWTTHNVIPAKAGIHRSEFVTYD
jgi:hypothetical protein